MTLFILAGGMGSRYGGLKQIDPFTENGEFIIDFSIYDAIQAGFDRVVFLITVYLGAVISLDVVWNLADIFNALMALPNLLCLLFLSNVIISETRKYLWNDNLDQEG